MTQKAGERLNLVSNHGRFDRAPPAWEIAPASESRGLSARSGRQFSTLPREMSLGLTEHRKEDREQRLAEIRDALGALPGSLGAVGSASEGHPVIADEALRGRRGMFTGANTDDTHLRGVDVERDIAVGRWASLREVAAGDVADGVSRAGGDAGFADAIAEVWACGSWGVGEGEFFTCDRLNIEPSVIGGERRSSSS